MRDSQHLQRVNDRIGPAVVRFCRGRVGRTFHSIDLLHYVRVLDPTVAPDSPSRILRDLRQRGAVDYQLVDRQASQYRVTAVKPEAAQ
jgi:hypothetical protein